MTPWSRPTSATSTRGEKGVPRPDPEDPPRRRANRRRGHGAFVGDQLLVDGVVGREAGEVRLEVLGSARGAESEEVLDGTCLEGATINTDEWKGYGRVGGRHRRAHQTLDQLGSKGT